MFFSYLQPIYYIQEVERHFITDCSKRSGYKAPEIPRNETYIIVHRNDEGRGQRSRWAFFSNLLYNPHALQHRQHDRCSHDRADLTSRIGSHGVHEQVIFFVIFKTFFLDNPGRHGEG